MGQNIQFKFVTKDGVEHHCNISGVCTIFDAADEIRQSIVNGDLQVKLEDVVKIVDVPG